MKKKLIGMALIALVVASCNSNEKKETDETTQDPNLITCEGIGKVKLSYSHDDLVNEFGAENVKDSTLTGGVKTTYLWEGTPQEVIVTWTENDAPFSKAEKLSVAQEFGDYHLEEGIGVGATLKDLVKLNNFLPITFSNFYAADDGFAVIQDFNEEGDITTKYPCLGGKLDIERTDNIDVNLLEDFKKENPVKSSHKAMEFIYTKVVELSVGNK
ncbi:hypothetical protein [Olivibacter sitiensis]|uniref:hypothetical protein n=1 Tax=Olivibacter sitiensis TaxID=376470 RepID=UPI0004201124|nr:hypothetical protein [Olivibacter sitiensis]